MINPAPHWSACNASQMEHIAPSAWWDGKPYNAKLHGNLTIVSIDLMYSHREDPRYHGGQYGVVHLMYDNGPLICDGWDYYNA